MTKAILRGKLLELAGGFKVVDTALDNFAQIVSYQVVAEG
jgi:hypothetical protein